MIHGIAVKVVCTIHSKLHKGGIIMCDMTMTTNPKDLDKIRDLAQKRWNKIKNDVNNSWCKEDVRKLLRNSDRLIESFNCYKRRGFPSR